jgi:hypothetical protein
VAFDVRPCEGFTLTFFVISYAFNLPVSLQTLRIRFVFMVLPSSFLWMRYFLLLLSKRLCFLSVTCLLEFLYFVFLFVLVSLDFLFCILSTFFCSSLVNSFTLRHLQSLYAVLCRFHRLSFITLL